MISLAALLIAFGPALHELQKLPAIVSHFEHHVQVHGEQDLTFLQYLFSHFGERSHADGDHASLPFHGDSICHGHPTVVPAPAEPPSLTVQVVRTVTVEPSDGQPCTRANGIFQPPRVS